MAYRICFVTGTRAEYGLLRILMREVRKDPELDLRLIATGAHFSKEFGTTYKDMDKDGFRIDGQVDEISREGVIGDQFPEGIFDGIYVGTKVGI